MFSKIRFKNSQQTYGNVRKKPKVWLYSYFSQNKLENLDYFYIFVKLKGKFMYRKSILSFFFLFAFFAVAISGYQCATNISQDQTGTIPIDPGDPGQNGYNGDPGQNRDTDDGYYYPDNYGRDRPRDLPEEPKDTCSRSTYRDLAKRHGEMAVFKIDGGSLKDYRMSQSLNFSLNCARIYVSMSKASGADYYKGALTVAYDDGRNLKFQQYSSGFTQEENKYNKWDKGSWRVNRKGVVDKKFHAIFENTDTALIFKIDHIEEREIRDGEDDLYAYGELYYKMFRYSGTAGRNDACWTSGSYMRTQRSQPPRRKKCWLLTTGPFSCRPHGVLEPRANFTDIDITGDLPCYNRFGIFRNLNIKGAFNVRDIKDL